MNLYPKVYNISLSEKSDSFFAVIHKPEGNFQVIKRLRYKLK